MKEIGPKDEGNASPLDPPTDTNPLGGMLQLYFSQNFRKNIMKLKTILVFIKGRRPKVLYVDCLTRRLNSELLVLTGWGLAWDCGGGSGVYGSAARWRHRRRSATWTRMWLVNDEHLFSSLNVHVYDPLGLFRSLHVSVRRWNQCWHHLEKCSCWPQKINFSFSVVLPRSVYKRVKMSSFSSEQQKQNARRVVLNQNVILCAYPMMTHSIYCFFLCKQCLSHNGKIPKQ